MQAPVNGTDERLDVVIAELRALRELLTRPAPDPWQAVKAATPKAVKPGVTTPKARPPATPKN